ncbi:MAG: excinuclease ABC subunit UvrA [Bacteroidales bacterium]|nr:excinuclease ABC subunit UvrA [Bacteroidales bacterium]
MIVAKGIKVNNLKNIDVSIPTNKLVVITGVSGSGKTSLAFDTLFAEGQRRYVESLSSYARGFLGRMNKPEVEKISGLSPAIAVEQRVMNRNPRSTVGTTTEIYEYIKLLFARIGKTYSPISNKEVKRHSVQNVVDEVLETFENQTKILVVSPLKLKAEENLREKLELLIQLGYIRIIIEGKIHRIEDVLEEKKLKLKEIDLLIDRLTIEKNNDEIYMRLSDSVHTAFNESDGFCNIINAEGEVFYYSNRFEADGITFVKPSANFFSFNNPYGACKTCSGSGQIEGISEDLVITRPDLSVYEGVVNCWKGEIMKKFQKDFINQAFEKFPIHKPYNQLTEQQKDFLWNAKGKVTGINQFFEFVKSESYKIQYRVLLSRYTGRTICPDCKGTRLRKDASYVKISGKSIVDLMLLPIDELLEFFNNIELTEYEEKVSQRLLTEIKTRLNYLIEVGLGYLTLNRQSSTLSGGESQRISLATSLGSPLVGSMYILDEPTIGLHSCDTQRLINVLLKLRDVGNTVIVVEHDEEVIKAADYIVDIGPFAGQNGGEVVFSGDYEKMLENANTLTAQFIRGERKIPLPETTRKWKEFLQINNVLENNLKGVSLKLPLKVKTVICGISGSGKTTLVKKALLPSIQGYLGLSMDCVPKCSPVEGSLSLLEAVEMVDQNPIGRSSRSNPVTYLGAFDDIRTLFADQPLAKKRGLKPGYFSFNTEGGRCEECKGEGSITISMQFMADVILKCEHCNGQRYKEEALEIKYREKSIAEVLDMTIEDAYDFFSQDDSNLCRRISQKIYSLIKVGLGYLKLGQSSITLSGGEAQRVKLAYFLSKGSNEKKTVFIFDEPSTGLHFYDILKLNQCFDELVNLGHTIVIIEHNLDIIKTADWIIELGPGGGKKGGNIIFEGTPKSLLQADTPTSKYLKEKF